MKPRTPRPGRRAAGFTILELMVVISLSAFLMALGAGVFLSGGKGAAYGQAIESVAGLISSARDASSSGVSATVVVDPESNRVFGLTARPSQELRFEPIPADKDDSDPSIAIARGLGASPVVRLDGTTLPTGGRTGGGQRLTAGETIDCGNYAVYDSKHGFHVELWINASRRPGGVLVQKGQSFKVQLDGPNRLTVQMKVEADGGPEDLSHSAELPGLAAGAWVGVYVTYDRQTLSVATDHGYGPVERGRWAESRPLRLDPDASLIVGSSNFDGVIDDFVFAAIHASEPLRMPQDVQILGKAQTIRLLGGRLDDGAHQSAPMVSFSFGQRVTTLEIGRNGLVSNKTITEDGAAPVDAQSADPRFEKKD